MAFRIVLACATAALATALPALSQTRVSPAPAWQPPSADSALYSASREELGAMIVRDMMMWFRIVFPDFHEGYQKSRNRQMDPPNLQEIYREPAVRWGLRPWVLVCGYRPPGQDFSRNYYFWHEKALDSAQPDTLRKLHRYHPFLLVGAPDVRCPATELAAYERVLGNFSPGAKFTDVPATQPNLLEPPDEMLPVSWNNPDDARTSANRFLAGDPAGLPFPRLGWIEDEIEWRRLWIRSARAWLKYCADPKAHPQVLESFQSVAAIENPEQLSEAMLDHWQKSMAGGWLDLNLWSNLAFCDYPAYVEELDRYNARLLSELDP